MRLQTGMCNILFYLSFKNCILLWKIKEWWGWGIVYILSQCCYGQCTFALGWFFSFGFKFSLCQIDPMFSFSLVLLCFFMDESSLHKLKSDRIDHLVHEKSFKVLSEALGSPNPFCLHAITKGEQFGKGFKLALGEDLVTCHLSVPLYWIHLFLGHPDVNYKDKNLLRLFLSYGLSCFDLLLQVKLSIGLNIL